MPRGRTVAFVAVRLERPLWIRGSLAKVPQFYPAAPDAVTKS